MVNELSNRYKFARIGFCMIMLMCILPKTGFTQDKKPVRKTIIVTCALGALGSATAQVLAKDYNLILTGRDLQKLQLLQKELQEKYAGEYVIKTLDFTQESSKKAFSRYLTAQQRSIDGLVLIPPKQQVQAKDSIPQEDFWIDSFKQQFTGPLSVLKRVVPHLSPSSRIVVIAGSTSVYFESAMPISCVTSRMWTTYIKALANQLGPKNIRINALSPGMVLTSFHQDRIAKQAKANTVTYEAQLEKEVADIPLRRHAQVEEVGKAIQFLLGDASSFINGTNLVLDGGLNVSYQ